jgi:hypothetical protein
MFFEEYMEHEMIRIFHYEDISRKQPHQVIFDPLMHLRVLPSVIVCCHCQHILNLKLS